MHTTCNCYGKLFSWRQSSSRKHQSPIPIYCCTSAYAWKLPLVRQMCAGAKRYPHPIHSLHTQALITIFYITVCGHCDHDFDIQVHFQFGVLLVSFVACNKLAITVRIQNAFQCVNNNNGNSNNSHAEYLYTGWIVQPLHLSITVQASVSKF